MITTIEVPLEFIQTLDDVEVFEEETAVFECETDKEGVTARWLKDGKKIPTSNQIKVESDGKKHRLVLKGCQLEDEAYYTCIVGERKTSASLHVKGKFCTAMYHQVIQKYPMYGFKFSIHKLVSFV